MTHSVNYRFFPASRDKTQVKGHRSQVIENKFNIAVLVHKCIYGVVPQYLLDLIKIKVSSWYQFRSYRGILLMDNTYRTKTTLGDRASENVVPKVWNRLPLEILLENANH